MSANFFYIAAPINAKTHEISKIYPKFVIQQNENLMIRGNDFYAVWVEERGLWSTDEQDVVRMIDKAIDMYVREHNIPEYVPIMYMRDAESKMIDNFHHYCKHQLRDHFNVLDERLIFSNTKTSKADYTSKRLTYALADGDHSAWDKLIGTLYSPEERMKIEWAIGAIVSGDSKTIQKFMVLYGAAGTGKSTVLNIIQKLFAGYFSVFDARALGSSSNAFALEAFHHNPLVAIQHDGDLSKIEDNTRLNSLVSHEEMTVNEKFKSTYSARFQCFLFMGTNKPVKITDAKSGLIRRLIDVTPTGNKIPSEEYKKLYKEIDFELGAIAKYCLDIYNQNKDRYENYIPTNMLDATNDFYNFVDANYLEFSEPKYVTRDQAYKLYLDYCEYSGCFKMPLRAFAQELKNYFTEYYPRKMIDGERMRNVYVGFLDNNFDRTDLVESIPPPDWLDFSFDTRVLDYILADCPAQLANKNETPCSSWKRVTTTLKDISTADLHYVMPPDNHIVIDFDIKDSEGNKSLALNIAEARKWPATYAELSKSGQGIHLHYIYNGDVTRLSRLYSDSVEIKVFTGKSSLRRKATKSNGLDILTISSGLPLKEEKVVYDENEILDISTMRRRIIKNLKKEYHADTSSSINFINDILEKGYKQGVSYDFSDLYEQIYRFACHSTNQAERCKAVVNKMKLKSKDKEDSQVLAGYSSDAPIVIYDVEVKPNMFLVCWKQHNVGRVVRMYNPTPEEVRVLAKNKLIGFNNKAYDNYIILARMMGYSINDIYQLNQSIINSSRGSSPDPLLRKAPKMSYLDLYDVAAKKQSLKKWELELGLYHDEFAADWDEPIPEEKWDELGDYCEHDVLATEALYNHLLKAGDINAREILAEISGLTVNDKTNDHTTRIIFGKNPKPKWVYTDFATGKQYDYRNDEIPPNGYVNHFDGYALEHMEEEKTDKQGNIIIKHVYKNMYRGEDVGFGGYVWAAPGLYFDVWTFDVTSMHPHSAKALDALGPATKNLVALVETRIAIKHGDFDTASKILMDYFGKDLSRYLTDKKSAKSLSNALKIAINSVYGLTSAKFTNPFHDPRNTNNIVALRGALFMVNLRHEVEDLGYSVVHIKTDSIKVANPDEFIKNFIIEYGNSYGYSFEVEHVFEKMCLVNDAVYIGKISEKDPDESAHGKWEATGTQFAVPYVYKTLFSKESITFDDVCELKQSTTALYLGEQFVGKVGRFTPVIESTPGAAPLLARRKAADGGIKYDSVAGAKGYLWVESSSLQNLEDPMRYVDLGYFRKLVDDAIETISKYGDFEQFAN